MASRKTDVFAQKCSRSERLVWSEVAGTLTKNNTAGQERVILFWSVREKKKKKKPSLLTGQNLRKRKEKKKKALIRPHLAHMQGCFHTLSPITHAIRLSLHPKLHPHSIPNSLHPFFLLLFLLLPETTEDSACNITPAYPKGNMAWENI